MMARWPLSLVVRTLGSQPRIRGSTPLGATRNKSPGDCRLPGFFDFSCGGPPHQQPDQVGPQEPPPEDEQPPHFLAGAEMSLSIAVDPHAGQATFCDELMTSSSKGLPHAVHSYSNMGIRVTYRSRYRDRAFRSTPVSPLPLGPSWTGPRSRRSGTFRSTLRGGGGGTS
jgi:hypothetical protein